MVPIINHAVNRLENENSTQIQVESKTISEDFLGQRLDAVLAKMYPEYSRSRLKKWLTDGTILVDGIVQKPRYPVQGNEMVTMQAVEASPNDLPWEPQQITLDIVYEDEALLVINKPAGLVVHPGAGNWKGTLVNGLLHYDPSLEALPRAGIVHRLDKDTSGLLVVARTLQAHTSLVRQLEKHQVQREYFAVIHGTPTAGTTMNYPIGRHKTKRTRMAVVDGGKEAITHYVLSERFRAHTAVQVNLETGRTHQIRVHFSHLKMPLVGDKTYGGRFRLPNKCSEEFKETLLRFPRQALHAKRLGLVHPVSKEEVEFEAPIPEDILGLLEAMREDLQSHEA